MSLLRDDGAAPQNLHSVRQLTDDRDTPARDISTSELIAEVGEALAELTSVLDELTVMSQWLHEDTADLARRIAALELEALKPGIVPRHWSGATTHEPPRPQ